MEAKEIMKSVLKIEQLYATDISIAMGRSGAYLSAMFSRGSVPKINTLLTFLDVTGYDLVARCRKDGYELIVDPSDTEVRKTQRAARRNRALRGRAYVSELLQAIVELDGTSPKDASTIMGKGRAYLDQAIHSSFKGARPLSDTLALMLNGLGYDLLARCRNDGFEILIDPKE